MSMYWKVKTLIKRNAVTKLGSNNIASFFMVKDYSVIYYADRNQWSCTCEAGSLWRVLHNEVCSHIGACKEVMDNAGKTPKDPIIL